MTDPVQIVSLRCLPGASAGLRGKTALVSLRLQQTQAWPDAPQVLWRVQWLLQALPNEAVTAGEKVSDWIDRQGVSAPRGKGACFAAALAALVVAIQREARDAVWQGQVLHQDATTLQLALPYGREAVLKQALDWALRGLAVPASVAAQAQVAQPFRAWLATAQAGGLAPNTLRFALAAYARDIPVCTHGRMLHLGWGSQAQVLDSSFTGQTSHLAACAARDKHFASRLLHQAGLPVPSTAKVQNWESALRVAKQLGWPVVVKPSNQDQGTAVVPGIKDEATLRQAYDAANRYSPGAVIVEQHVPGHDHRLLVVRGRLLMATRRIPGGVLGDGQHSMAELVEQVNADPRRGTSKRSLLMRLALDAEALACLAEQDLQPDAVPAKGRFVTLRRTANISTGGTAVDVTAQIHPDNRRLAERAARIIGLDIAGVDFLCPDISRSWREVGGAICEVNAQPGFRPHWLGDPGRDINGEIIDLLFEQRSARIPTAAITGTNGKSTTARMLHHIWRTAGKVAGVCTTQGVWVGDDLVTDRGLAGFPGASMLLNDPAVEVAVLELPRKGLIRFGHPCDQYDVAALLNVQDDHIGADGIQSMAQMAQLKAQVLERARHAVVVNAEDPLCLAAARKCRAVRHILVATTVDHPALIAHRNRSDSAGNACVFCRLHDAEPWIVLARGEEETLLMRLHDIPATMQGLLRFNQSNALFAAALAWAQGVEPAVIQQALSSFHNSVAQNPGRYNFIEGLPFRVLVDYGHNPAGMRGLMDLMARVDVSGKRVLVNCNGLRFRHHLAQELPWYAKAFDHIFLGPYQDYFRRNAQGFAPDDPAADMFRQARAMLLPLLAPGQSLHTLDHHMDALSAGLESCGPGDFLVLLAEPADAMAALQAYRERVTGGQDEA